MLKSVCGVCVLSIVFVNIFKVWCVLWMLIICVFYRSLSYFVVRICFCVLGVYLFECVVVVVMKVFECLSNGGKCLLEMSCDFFVSVCVVFVKVIVVVSLKECSSVFLSLLIICFKKILSGLVSRSFLKINVLRIFLIGCLGSMVCCESESDFDYCLVIWCV